MITLRSNMETVVRVVVALTLLLVGAILTTGCAYESPTGPTPVVEPVRPAVAQIVIKVSGPDNWFKDKLMLHVVTLDRAGATTGDIVECDSTMGYFEPRSFSTASRGTELLGVKVGAVVTCRHQNVEASYVISELDWRIIVGPGPTPAPAPVAPPKPPPAGGGE